MAMGVVTGLEVMVALQRVVEKEQSMKQPSVDWHVDTQVALFLQLTVGIKVEVNPFAGEF